MSSAMRTVLMGSRTMTISSAVLSAVNIILHSTGAYLLVCLYRSGSRTVQTIFLINLSIFEVIISIISLGEDSLDFVDNESLYKTTTSTSVDLQKVDEIIYIVIYSSYMLYFWNIFMITGDRLAGTVLHLRYPQYCTIGRAKKIVVVSWISTILFTLTCTLIWEFVYTYDFGRLFTTYFLPVLNGLILLFVVGSYTFVFRKYMERRRENLTIQELLENKQQLWKIFRGSKFYVSVILVFSSVLSMVIPQVTIVVLKQDIEEFVVLDIVKIFYEVTFFLDACIYIMIHPAVRRLALRKLHIKQKEEQPKIRLVRLDKTIMGGEAKNDNSRSTNSKLYEFTSAGVGEPSCVTKVTFVNDAGLTENQESESAL